ncbi:hypothetical protein FDI21_gp187 [Pseudomonas phage Noxifer]|uniref:Uncharacterized protein n=1 Tax=Pseudomonas phage Noxifer TaxID=2006684 RepID=A0A1Y0T094_9CAUD|nr:hypothetical protein FDI21_gp187 [Pseudomonas phage Noxifer]ARV77356.1 hypothetical protein NOXIFER_187 [Pseudomonas phage Noxifer]
MDNIKQLLTSSDKGRSRAQGILCYMFRNTLLWHNLTYHRWVRATNFYFEKPHNAKNPDRGNLNKALIQDDLSWASFKKGLDLLNPYKAILTIELTWKSGKRSTYAVEIDLVEDEDDVILTSPLDVADTDLLTMIKERQKNKPLNTLARFYSRILQAEGVDNTRWTALLDEYAKNPLNGFTGTKKETAGTISSIQRQLFEPRLSWNNFRKGLTILGPIQEDYILRLEWIPEVKRCEDVTETHVTIRDPFSTGRNYAK